MISDKELTEYRILCTTVTSLHEKFIEKKDELRRILEETLIRRREALLVLAKANGLTRHLTGRQRQLTGLSYRLADIKLRINQSNPFFFKNLTGSIGENEVLPEIRPENQDGLICRRELKQKGLMLIALIDRIKKKLLQFELLEKRCRELILSINKALEAFRHESRAVHRKIYRFGFFSLFFRFMRRFCGGDYFAANDLDDIAALGHITGLVLKIADSPLV